MLPLHPYAFSDDFLIYLFLPSYFQASDAKRKLKETKCAGTHKCLKLFKTAKLAVTQATNKDRAVQTQAGYVAKIIGFVEDAIGPSAISSEFSWLEYPEHHEEFLKTLQNAGMQDDAIANYKKVMGNLYQYIFGNDMKAKECCWAGLRKHSLFLFTCCL